MPGYGCSIPFPRYKISEKPAGNSNTASGSVRDHSTVCTHVTPFIPASKLIQNWAIFMTITHGKIGYRVLQGVTRSKSVLTTVYRWGMTFSLIQVRPASGAVPPNRSGSKKRQRGFLSRFRKLTEIYFTQNPYYDQTGGRILHTLHRYSSSTLSSRFSTPLSMSSPLHNGQNRIIANNAGQGYSLPFLLYSLA